MTLAYDDVFGGRRKYFDSRKKTDGGEDLGQVPMEPRADGSIRPQDSGPEPLNYEGFASPLPLLLERPSIYLSRMEGAAQALIKTTDNEDVTSRILYTPAISLPVLLLQGNELLSDAALQYPLLHGPSNHPYQPDQDIASWALALIAAQTAGGILHEPGDGDLLAYGIDGEYEIPDELWDSASDWATEAAPLLAALNTARLIGFALKDPRTETDPLSLLAESWGLDADVERAMERGKAAADALSDMYGVFTDVEFKPFSER